MIIDGTQQFLSTVILSYLKCKHTIARDEVLGFIIDEVSYSLSILELGQSLGFEYHDAIDFGSFYGKDFWPRIGVAPTPLMVPNRVASHILQSESFIPSY